MFSLNHQEPLKGSQEHTSNGHVTSQNLWETISTSRATRGGHSSMWATEKEAVERNGLLNISQQGIKSLRCTRLKRYNDEMILESEKNGHDGVAERECEGGEIRGDEGGGEGVGGNDEEQVDKNGG